MSEILVITNRKLCAVDFSERIREIAACRPTGIILREKELSVPEYTALSEQITAVCEEADVPCILHSFPETAAALGIRRIHLPLQKLREMSDAQKQQFEQIGASCHAPEEAQEAAALGATYVIAGHIFATDCKKGLPGRGLDFLKAVCQAVSLPVYAIGGITPERVPAVLESGARGICVMSGLMQCADVSAYFAALWKGEQHDTESA